MPVKPNESLVVAQNLRIAEDNEAGRRGVASRAYYAAFHAAYSYHLCLKVPGSVGAARGRHEQLLAQLAMPMVPKTDPNYGISKGLAKSLRLAYAHRITADYSPDEIFPASFADDALGAAVIVVTESFRAIEQEQKRTRTMG
ncbi:hypothetical protein [Herbaspirillum aquaticum]|uniref:hypothetical protein n=1 Tax=Herbaspirillum aquaticum TaxID=568783 RepID=UPI001132504E|nr:hypothetical protein [Herbaspirillum aquaticum]